MSLSKTDKTFKTVGKILKGWTVLIIIFHIALMLISKDPLVPLVEIPATLLIYAGIPYGIFWVIRKRIMKKKPLQSI